MGSYGPKKHLSKTSIIMNFNRVSHYKPSILGYPFCWKHPHETAWNIRFPKFFWGKKNLSKTDGSRNLFNLENLQGPATLWHKKHVFTVQLLSDGWNPARKPTWNVWNPINNGKNYLSTGAGFQPSTAIIWFVLFSFGSHGCFFNVLSDESFSFFFHFWSSSLLA